MSFSSKYTALSKELKEEASRLLEISKELRLKSIELKFYNRLYSKMGRFAPPDITTDSARICTISNKSVESASLPVQPPCDLSATSSGDFEREDQPQTVRARS